MLLYMRYILSIFLAYASFCFAIVVDVDEFKHQFVTSTGTSAATSVRVVTFDTEQQKLLKIQYLLVTKTSSTPVTTLLEPNIGTVEYKHVDRKLAISVKPTPPADADYWYRVNGSITGVDKTKVHPLKDFDTTCPDSWKVFHTPDGPVAPLDMGELIQDLNAHTKISKREQTYLDRLKALEEALQKPMKSQTKKTKEQKLETLKEELQTKTFKRPPVTESLPIQLLFSGQKEDYSKSFIADQRIKGGLGELFCDLTMMTQAFIKLDGKCGSDNGLDGIYKNGHIIVASESKFHQRPPSLKQIFSTSLQGKFDIPNKRAITQINASVRDQILEASPADNLYILAYAPLLDGTIDCHIKPYTIPLLPDPDEQTPTKTLKPLTPNSSDAERQAWCISVITQMMKDTGLSFQDTQKHFTQSFTIMGKKPATTRKLILKQSDSDSEEEEE